MLYGTHESEIYFPVCKRILKVHDSVLANQTKIKIKARFLTVGHFYLQIAFDIVSGAVA